MRQYRISKWTKGQREFKLVEASSVRVALARYLEGLEHRHQLPTPGPGMINSLDLEYEDLGVVVKIGIPTIRTNEMRHYSTGGVKVGPAVRWWTWFDDVKWHPASQPIPEGYTRATSTQAAAHHTAYVADRLSTGLWSR